MNQPAWRGIFPSLPTPFTESGDLDLDAQRAIVDFAIDGGAAGLICFGLAGEVFRITPEERLRLLEVIVDEAAGRVPVLAGVGTDALHSSIALARATESAGADGIVIPPPNSSSLTPDQLVEYFVGVANATKLPVMLQDAPEYLEIEVGPETVAEVAAQAPGLHAVKLEVGAVGAAAWVKALGERLVIFGGSGGLYLVDSLEQGVDGVAPGVDLTDKLAHVYARWAEGDVEQARQEHTALLPLLVFQMQTIEHYNATAKYVLQRRGVPVQVHLRAPCARLDDAGRAILDHHLAALRLTAEGLQA